MAEDINKLPADIFPLTLGCEVQVLQCAHKHVYSIESELPCIIFFNFVTHEPHCGQNLKSLFNSSSNTMYFFVLSGELQQVASTTASSADAVSISTWTFFVLSGVPYRLTGLSEVPYRQQVIRQQVLMETEAAKSNSVRTELLHNSHG